MSVGENLFALTCLNSPNEEICSSNSLCPVADTKLNHESANVKVEFPLRSPRNVGDYVRLVGLSSGVVSVCEI